MTDRKLPGLECALNNEVMRLRLSPGRERGRGEDAVSQVQSRILKYTPGKRCVIEYRLELGENQHGPQRLIGKLYRKDRGQVIFENLCNLWEAANGNERPGMYFGMPKPVAYLSDIGMVLQGVVPGRQLSTFSTPEELSAAVRYVAENLAALHGLAVAAGEKRALHDHIKKYCHPGPRVLKAARPELAPLVENILTALAQNEDLNRAPICPIHGDLNLAQIFITADRAFFIDLDGFCFSHAALDVGNFLITLKAHFGARSEELTRIFLDGYLSHQPPQILAGLRVYQALACLRRAVICYRLQVDADWPRQARQLLEAGIALFNEKPF